MKSVLVRFDRAVQRLDVEAFEQHWPVIEKLARTLIERGKLSEAEIVAMLEDNLKTAAPRASIG